MSQQSPTMADLYDLREKRVILPLSCFLIFYECFSWQMHVCISSAILRSIRLGDYDVALTFYQRSLAIFTKSLGSDHPFMAVCLNNMGDVFIKKGEYDRALVLLHRALIICETVWGLEHVASTSTLTNIGLVFLDQSRYQDALEFLSRVVNFCSKKTCEPQPHGYALFGLARALVATKGSQERAIKLVRQAKKVFEKTPNTFQKELAEVNVWEQK